MTADITPQQLAEKLRAPGPPLLIDVREPYEFTHCRIAGAQLRPLGQIAFWAKTLDPEMETVLYCHVGERSAWATAYLQKMGFKHVLNLAGGIDAWAAQLEPDMPRY
jgi:rhodanese-related sulfurtransferase